MAEHRFKIGDVVVLKTKCFEEKYPKLQREAFKVHGIDKSYETSFLPPHMVVIAQEKSKSGVLSVRCTWYNHNTGKFPEREFIESILELAETDSSYNFKSIMNSIFKFSILGASAFLVLRDIKKK